MTSDIEVIIKRDGISVKFQVIRGINLAIEWKQSIYL